MPALVRVENGEHISIDIDKSAFVIGRIGKADFVLGDRCVSREHALITLEEDHYFLTDLDSSNGTQLNGHVVHGGPHRLQDNDSIMLGHVRLTFVDDTLDTLPSSKDVVPGEIHKRTRQADVSERAAQDVPETAGMRYPVFISHSSKDDAFVTQLANYLLEHSVIAWVDHINIAPGKNWSSEIEKILGQVDSMIVILSPDATISKSVEAEWTFFRDQGKPIYPVKIAPCPTPLFLYTYQVLDLTERQEAGLSRLLKTLRSVLFGESDESSGAV